MTAPIAKTALTQTWMALAVREIERSGPLDDSAVMAEAMRRHSHPQERLRERAWLLGQRLGLDTHMAHWRDAAWLLGAALSVAVLLLANGIVFAMLSDARSINAGSAFVAALGVHALTLLLWLAGLLWLQRWPGAGMGLSLGKLLLQLLARWPLGEKMQRPHALALVSGAKQLLRSSRLAPWAFGLVSHVVWTASFVLVLLGLLLAFALRQYQLTWESTILSPAFFDAFVRTTGWLPGLLGFAVPEGVAALRVDAATGQLAIPARTGALWLLGCVLVYGLLPRALCAALCWGVWQRRKNRVALDTADPYFRQLLARFAALQPSLISDMEHALPSSAPTVALPAGAYQPVLALVGFELLPTPDWPPQLATRAALVECIAGSIEERSQVLAALAQLRPQALVLVCDAAATPDRGTERFLRDACRHAEHCALWLLDSNVTNDKPPQRWHDWLDTLHWPQLARLHHLTEAQIWAEKNDGRTD